ncbi:MAG: hypothetical protein P4M05_14800 [Bradyrhizobium sp.]|nr:hypothetical protein [Bradyrhizobium sp.]
MNRDRVSMLPAVLVMAALLLSADRAAAQEVGLAPLDVKEVARGYRPEALKLKPIANEKSQVLGKISHSSLARTAATSLSSLRSTIFPDLPASLTPFPSAASNWTIPPATLYCREASRAALEKLPVFLTSR